MKRSSGEKFTNHAEEKLRKKTQGHLLDILNNIKYDAINHQNVVKYQTDEPKLDPENLAKPKFTSMDPSQAANRPEISKKIIHSTSSISFNDIMKNMKNFEVDHHQTLLKNQNTIDIIESKRDYMNNLNEILFKKTFLTGQSIGESSLIPSHVNIKASPKKILRKSVTKNSKNSKNSKNRLNNRNINKNEEPPIDDLLNSISLNASKQIFFNPYSEFDIPKLQLTEVKSGKFGFGGEGNTIEEFNMNQYKDEEIEFSEDDEPEPQVTFTDNVLHPKYLRKPNQSRMSFNKFGTKLLTFVSASKAKKQASEIEKNHFHELTDLPLDPFNPNTKSNEEYIRDRRFLFNTYNVFEKYCKDEIKKNKYTKNIVERRFGRLNNGLEQLTSDVNEFDTYLVTEIKKDMQSEIHSNDRTKFKISNKTKRMIRPATASYK